MAQTLTQTYGVGQIMSPTGIADAARLGISTVTHGAGPYVLDPQASVAGDEYTYVARTNYYAPSRIHFKKIILKIIANPQAVIDALKTGQVDATVDADYATVKQAIATGLQVKYEPFVWQGLNLIDRNGVVSKPLGNVLVRQAINYAINRTEIASALLGSYGMPTDEVTVPGADGYSSAMSDYYAYNPSKARQLLAQAGYPHGFTLPVLAVQYDGLNTTAEAIAGELAAVGIKVQLIDPTDPVTYEMGMVSQKYPVIAVAYGAQPMYLAGQELFLPQAPVFNGFHTQSSVLAGLYGQAAASAPAQRAALDVQMNDYLVRQAWFAPVVFTPVFVFARASLGGVAETAGSPVADPLDWYNT
jgi:peptide/nickel transport system substrate-binding protein